MAIFLCFRLHKDFASFYVVFILRYAIKARADRVFHSATSSNAVHSSSAAIGTASAAPAQDQRYLNRRTTVITIVAVVLSISCLLAIVVALAMSISRRRRMAQELNEACRIVPPLPSGQGKLKVLVHLPKKSWHDDIDTPIDRPHATQ